MTDEEMAEEYAKPWKTSLAYVSVKEAYLAGLKAGKDMNVATKWHDLRKDPNDLPVRRCIDNDGNVVRLFHNSWDKKLTWYRYDFHECEWWQMETEPIAWCEIPRYMEE
jgi:hypothetical protein